MRIFVADLQDCALGDEVVARDRIRESGVPGWRGRTAWSGARSTARNHHHARGQNRCEEDSSDHDRSVAPSESDRQHHVRPSARERYPALNYTEPVTLSAEFTDPRLVAIYDSVCAYAPGTQPDFYLALAEELGAAYVIDIGCGTGLITREFIARGYAVIGLEPSAEMLAVARARPMSDRAHWIHGDAHFLDVTDADFAFMAGHVAQFFLTDESWTAALERIRGALRPGGWLSFESRNPRVREWEAWSPDRRKWVTDPRTGAIEMWTEVTAVSQDVVTCHGHYRLAESGEELTAETSLRFRTLDELERSLGAAGLKIERAYGGWDRRPFTEDSPEMILVAQRSL